MELVFATIDNELCLSQKLTEKEDTHSASSSFQQEKTQEN